MILERYLRTRLLTYFFLINGSLTLLYNLIEFVEKLMRQTNSSVADIAFFITLNLLPSFFELIPLSSWLATGMLIWELYQRGEWDTFNLLSISKTKIIRSLLFAGFLLSLLNFVGKEIAVHPITRLAEKYKMQKFKAQQSKKLLNVWFSPEKNSFLHFEYLDLKSNVGNGLIIFYVSDNFVAEKKIEAPNFSIDPETQNIFFEHGTTLNIASNEASQLRKHTIFMPGLFLYLKMFRGLPSLKTQIKNLIIAKSLSLQFPFNQEFGKLLARILSYLQPLIYVLLTFCLFFLWLQSKWIKWALIAAPYPILLVLNAFCNFMLIHNTHAAVVLIPYLLSTAIILLCLHKMRPLQ